MFFLDTMEDVDGSIWVRLSHSEDESVSQMGHGNTLQAALEDFNRQ